MEEDLTRWQIPAFGHWDLCDELPITQYFESALQAGLLNGHSFRRDEDLFKVPAHHHQMVEEGGERGEKHQQMKQGRDWDVRSQKSKPRRLNRAPKAVDEDLYKIPPELIYQKPKRKGLVRDLLSRCLGLICIP